MAVNRLRVTGLIKDHGKVTGVRARCGLTGEELLVTAKVVINAAGPWVEEVCSYDGVDSPKSLVLSKGIHICVSRETVPLSKMILTVTSDRRPVFLIPRGDVVYIGTTDTAYPNADIWPEVLPEEVHYLYKPVAHYLGISLSDADCIGSWAGLRPLIAQRGKSTKEISRKDEIWISDSGMITIAGGKLTGYRKMAEDTVDQACKFLGCTRPDPTDDIPLPGGDFEGSVDRVALDLARRYPMADKKAARLASLYGAECVDVVAQGQAQIGDSDMIEGEVSWAVRSESAFTLEDVIYRRMRAAYYSPGQVHGILAPVADLMAIQLGWTEGEKATQLENARSRLAADLAPVKGYPG
jgi:glycerol-3-phosphate dehydrogenase